ncbi:MAG: hypothetical protein AB1758_35080, partial [Candidatus Eremiobacterota bacterium]
DAVPPASPADFRVVDAGATGVTLGWTATGDDGTLGQASSYQMRIAESPISENGGEGTVSWARATPVSGLPVPGPSGVPQEVRVTIQPGESRTYHFGLKVLDRMGNASSLASLSACSKPATRVLSDDMEGEDARNWTAEGTWARVDVEGHGKVFTDSPEGAYASNANSSLVSREFDLSAVREPVLRFDLKCDTEARYDVLHVEATSDSGLTWTELLACDGYRDWSTCTVDLSACQSQKRVQVRFRLTSDRTFEKDGVYIDNVIVAGEAP